MIKWSVMPFSADNYVTKNQRKKQDLIIQVMAVYGAEYEPLAKLQDIRILSTLVQFGMRGVNYCDALKRSGELLRIYENNFCCDFSFEWFVDRVDEWRNLEVEK